MRILVMTLVLLSGPARAHDCEEQEEALKTCAAKYGKSSEQFQTAKTDFQSCMLKAQAKEDDEVARQEANDSKIRNNPKVMSVVFGAEFCMAEAIRKSAIAEIATEKKYSRIGGAVSLGKLYRLQQRIRRVDEFMAKERELLRTAPNLRHVKPARCTDRLVRIAIACKSEDPPDGCDEGGNDQVLKFIATVDDEDSDE